MSVSIHIKTEIHQIISTKFSFILKFHYSTSLSCVWLTMAAFWKTSLSKMIGILWVGKPIAWTTALNGEMASNPHTTWKMCLLLRHIKLISFWNNEYICIPTSSARKITSQWKKIVRCTLQENDSMFEIKHYMHTYLITPAPQKEPRWRQEEISLFLHQIE